MQADAGTNFLWLTPQDSSESDESDEQGGRGGKLPTPSHQADHSSQLQGEGSQDPHAVHRAITRLLPPNRYLTVIYIYTSNHSIEG